MVWVALLGAAAASAQPREGGRRKTEQVIILKGDEGPASHVLRVAPDAATLVLFDTPLVRESVDTRLLQSFERDYDAALRSIGHFHTLISRERRGPCNGTSTEVNGRCHK